MQLVYQLGGAGWADARISHNSKYRDMAVSYLSDALGDMTHAAVRLVRGAREVSFSFQDEPGEHRWLLTRGESDSLRIRILWFRDTFSRRPQERGEEVFTCDCTVPDFIGQVSHELHNILSEECRWLQKTVAKSRFSARRLYRTSPSPDATVVKV